MNFHRKKKKITKEIKKRLLRYGNPRIQMALILIIVGFTGFISSAALAKLGLKEMWLRYPAAIGLSYVSFFFCLHLWIKYILSSREYKKTIDNTIEEVIDEFEIDIEFSGVEADTGSSGSFFSEVFDLGLDLDDGIILLIIVILAVILLSISIYFIVIAPTFLAEILVEIILLAGFSRRIKKLQRSSWMLTAFNNSWVYFLIIAVLFSIGGYFIQNIDPTIITIGDFFDY